MQIIPREWVDAEVASLYEKKCKMNNLNCWVEIFLIDTINKLYASVIDERLRSYLTRKLDLSLYGFRKEISTFQAILVIGTLIQNAFEQKPSVVLLFVALKKAFDNLPVRAIIQRLINDSVFAVSRKNDQE